METETLDKRALGAAIQARREAVGWSANRLADKIKMGRGYLLRIEAGEANVGLERIARLADALGVAVDDWLHAAGAVSSRPIAGELGEAYDGLDTIHRRALLIAGHALREAQEGYAEFQAERPSLHVVANESEQDDNEIPPPKQEPDEAMQQARRNLAERGEDFEHAPAAYDMPDNPEQ